ncbi:hypothetical protein DEO72_LG2g378 [Vigna unguiculata]|uniref:Uncharacterized protein n=1 Tax=Vigna unguiculata TaxID=3917 RepID=A0A4D6KX84_VIGUN|nr:hypothetical protein DEO72_LG2g378 [Vigna unguiculata]
MAGEAQSGSQQPQTTPDTKNTDITKPNNDSNKKSEVSEMLNAESAKQRVKGLTDSVKGTSVSYTHLDVYKRQLRSSVSKVSPTA